MDELQSYISTHQIFHLIFDFDQTIAKLVLPWDRYLDDIEATLRTHDSTIVDAYIRGDLHLNDMQNAYVKKYGDTLLTLFRNHNRTFETQKLQGVKPNTGLIDFIKQEQGLTMYLWTSNMPDAIVSFLKKENIYNRFKKIITRNDVTFLKPETESFDLLYDPKIKKEKYALVGDSQSDELAAKRAGISYFGVNPLR